MLSGEFDIAETNRKGEIVRIIDIKTRWTVHSFYEHFGSEMDKKERAQLEGYNILADCPEAEIANVLTNNHPDEIERELHYEALKFRDPNDPDKVVFEVPMWRKIQILKKHVFDKKTLDKFIKGDYLDEDAQAEYDSFVEIPLMERVIRQTKEADYELQAEIVALYPRVLKYLAEVWNIHNVG